ncbi:Fic/DOC family N-terminal domain-containing protein [Halorubrum sp. AS12]|uniref:Fic/DOC family N-terminal domain-containing protein n=1 Tax=Halorubrum sp. AS12 TaxID=3409687 RepID=UPI003DA75449
MRQLPVRSFPRRHRRGRIQRSGLTHFPPSINTEQLITPLAEATQALGRLHGIGPRVGSREILIEPFIRKEALESSQIEGTHATLSDSILIPKTTFGDVHSHDSTSCRNRFPSLGLPSYGPRE